MGVEHEAATDVRGLGIAGPVCPSGGAAQRVGRRTRPVCVMVRVLATGSVIVLSIAAGPVARATDRYYTEAQAAAGQTVFAGQCAICHGENLQGKVGPALAGEQFLSVSQYQELTADFLFRIMSRQMPKNAPGSLSKTQYLDVLAYILKVNGYPAGSQQLTADDHELKQIKIEPTGKSQESNLTEDRQ